MFRDITNTPDSNYLTFVSAVKDGRGWLKLTAEQKTQYIRDIITEAETMEDIQHDGESFAKSVMVSWVVERMNHLFLDEEVSVVEAIGDVLRYLFDRLDEQFENENNIELWKN